MKRYARLHGDETKINMIMVIGSINGVLRIYHNETNNSSSIGSPTRSLMDWKRVVVIRTKAIVNINIKLSFKFCIDMCPYYI